MALWRFHLKYGRWISSSSKTWHVKPFFQKLTWSRYLPISVYCKSLTHLKIICDAVSVFFYSIYSFFLLLLFYSSSNDQRIWQNRLILDIEGVPLFSNDRKAEYLNRFHKNQREGEMFVVVSIDSEHERTIFVWDWTAKWTS